jgi:hypothetical protein
MTLNPKNKMSDAKGRTRKRSSFGHESDRYNFKNSSLTHSLMKEAKQNNEETQTSCRLQKAKRNKKMKKLNFV